jgi:pSer/pThr/pTyr-binding forkhead associated (FHA) protein
VRELEADLRAAEASIHRLESETRSRSARIDELEKSNEQWRATAGETRQAMVDTAVNPALRDSGRNAAEEGAAAEPAPDGSTRLLIQSDSGREIVHVLGRKTSIGRTPDNDLQIEAKFVSRHHAVILAGPVQTIIEDLNSTNGVQVNGRRISRYTLKDGDQIAIGRAHYRFAVRKSGGR